MNKIDKIFDRLLSIDTTLASQHQSLKDHIRRTELLENEILPIKKHVNMVSGVIKFITLCGVIASILEVFYLVLK